MAQRQFRSDDTSTWLDKYGTGSAGALSISSSIADSARSGYASTTASGTAASTALTAGSGSGFSAGDLVVIHQTQGTGSGIWELNKISSVGGGTNWTMSYTLMNTYGTDGQVYRLVPYTTISITSAGTLTAETFNGTTKGIVWLLGAVSASVAGPITAASAGYAGGAQVPSSGDNVGFQGETYTGVAGTQILANNTSGGGGGKHFVSVGGGGGGGGAGHAGVGTQGGNNDNGDSSGLAGAASTDNAGLTIAQLGSGGGSGGSRSGIFVGKVGGTGGRGVVIICPTITVDNSTGQILATGATAGTSPGGGGAGSGGFILLKGNIITLNTTRCVATGGTGGSGSGSIGQGGAAGTGRIHADYGTSIAGTTSPTIDSRQDNTLIPTGGGAFLYNFI